ncbi:MAG: hypothetical protein BRC29_02795 [Nanohaloarchaea archaeon SW_7_43_1]|nr:MAG: hypothetical protein BRC29_02795 [Nanohaloarchaea archaeon SW_7_43_1]
MDTRLVALGLVGAVAGIAAFQVYETAGILSAVTVLIFCTWVLFKLRSPLGVWNSVSTLLNPFISFFNIYLISFTYLSLQGHRFAYSAYRSLGFALLGTALSMLIYKYWNI